MVRRTIRAPGERVLTGRQDRRVPLRRSSCDLMKRAIRVAGEEQAADGATRHTHYVGVASNGKLCAPRRRRTAAMTIADDTAIDATAIARADRAP